MGKKQVTIQKTGKVRGKPKIGLIARRYAPREVIGRGGSGEVLLAYDRQLERQVAMKRVHVRLGESGQRAQFAMEEAKRLAWLQHPNIVTVFDVLDHKEDVVIVMEYLSGHTLEARQHPMSVGEFIEVAKQCLDALGAAHSLGMVHLDIKATNIMLTELATGRLQVKLLDFGLAAMTGEPSEPNQIDSGDLVGCVYTVAPEQLERKPVSARTDLYSLGCVFYHALTRREPFLGVSVQGVIDAHLRHDYRPLIERRPDLPLSLCSWVEGLMSRYPEDRPESAVAALASLLALAPLWESLVEMNLAGRQSREIDSSDQAGLQNALGSMATVSGVVDRVWENNAGTIRFLNFESVDHSDFSAVILLKAGHAEFERNRLDGLIGKCVRVTGALSDFHGSPQIVVKSPEQIAEGIGRK